MSNKRQEKIFELYSAYLDGELSEKQRSDLEKRLQADPALRQQCQKLEATRRLLRSAPRLKVPRNFTLTAAMLPQKKAAGVWVPVMSISSALATLLLLISFIGNLAMASQAVPMAAQSNYAEAADSMLVTSEKAMQDESTADQEPPMIIQWYGDIADGKGGGGPAGAVPQAEDFNEEAPFAAAPMEAFPSATQAEEPADMEGETVSDIQAEQSQIESTPQVELAGQAVTEPTSEILRAAPETQNPILGIAPSEERGQIIEEQSSESYTVHQEQNQPVRPIIILRWGLLGIAIACAAAAVIIRHRMG